MSLGKHSSHRGRRHSSREAGGAPSVVPRLPPPRPLPSGGNAGELAGGTSKLGRLGFMHA